MTITVYSTPHRIADTAMRPALRLATYRGVTWRVAAVRHWPQTYIELETPSGGRCAVPATDVRLHEGGIR
ncbi:hypothetical protein [Rhodococcus jostii]|uniref:hypothetical protein n=1 Tax=Rhodococcus jostii TaxID=132919 RepID=UPI00363B2952